MKFLLRVCGVSVNAHPFVGVLCQHCRGKYTSIQSRIKDMWSKSSRLAEVVGEFVFTVLVISSIYPVLLALFWLLPRLHFSFLLISFPRQKAISTLQFVRTHNTIVHITVHEEVTPQIWSFFYVLAAIMGGRVWMEADMQVWEYGL